MRVFNIIALLFVLLNQSMGQASGSSTSHTGLGITTGGTHSESSETLYIGPGTYQIDGIWQIYSKSIVVDTNAIITGTGTIQIYNPFVAGGTTSRTLIDGNNSTNPIEVNVVLNNASGMEITDIMGPFANVTSNNTLYAGKDLNLAIDGADIWLDADVIGSLRFDVDATISNYSVDRMVITNNVNVSHMIKDAFGPSTFFFPMGIADGDYTPASLTGAGPYNVSVTNYSTSGSVEQTPSEGMDRTWQIFGAIATEMSLIHNTPSTDGASFVEPSSFITQYQGNSVWATKGASDRISAGVNTSSDPASAIPSGITDFAYFTKVSDMISPLPVYLLSFQAVKQSTSTLLTWLVTNELKNKGFEVERSSNGKIWVGIGYVGAKPFISASTKTEYLFTDLTPMDGINYYRLKQIDLDGKISYSPARTVLYGKDIKVSVYPNPTTQDVFIDGLIGDETIQVFDANGNLVSASIETGTSKLNISLAHVKPGIYFINIIGKNKSVHQIIKD